MQGNIGGPDAQEVEELTQGQRIADELLKLKHYLDTHSSDPQKVEQHARKLKNLTLMCDQIKAQKKSIPQDRNLQRRSLMEAGGQVQGDTKPEPFGAETTASGQGVF